MWSHERQSKILGKLLADGKVLTVQIADLFNVSRETIRRDLLELENNGSLKRVHGGAVPIGRNISPEPRFSDRLGASINAKRAIGRVALQLIEPDSTLFIDAGTTTLAFAQELVLAHFPLRILTNSIEISQLTAPSDHIDTLLLGGTPHTDVPATYGELTLSEIDRFLADIAILSPVAFHATRGASDFELHEAEVARKMVRCSKACIMLCHSDKMSQESRVTICRPEEVDHLVTDRGTPSTFTLPRGKVHFASETD
ncbi:DeoR/GlpR family DNA-binding transcription regulator [Celeribacter halophilus]|uniref:DeoR/GlpR family DNA-binding transcription regulator n=1 Tax=Celeribacter halophilus TaxID=576117 RepID=UPI003A9038C2